MPVFPNRVPNLQMIGPVIEVMVHPPGPIAKKLSDEGKPIPRRKLLALIDTGASGSCINDDIAQDLGLVARDIVDVKTPSGSAQQPVYDLGFSLPMANIVLQVQALGADLKEQPYQALIGRDILRFCTLIYNGWDNSYQLHI